MLAEALVPIQGRIEARIAPPVPARSRVADFTRIAAEIGITLMPHQEWTARYLTALGPEDRWLYREVAVIMARQNGKTTLLVPLIVMRLLDGQRVMMSAQNRSLPLEVFEQVAEFMSRDLTLFPRRSNGRQQLPKFGSGAEGISLTNGGALRIAAATRAGARGRPNDLVIIDELREIDPDFIAAAKPTVSASMSPQVVYLSNAGEQDSEVLNAVRARAGTDHNLAYLEWSAAPERAAGDRVGWAEANPALGHEAEGMGSVLATLEADHQADQLAGTMANFETEHLCRWVVTMRERLVDEASWNLCRVEALPRPSRSCIGVAMDPGGTRASAALAWQMPDGKAAVRLLYDVTLNPSVIGEFGADIRADALRRRVTRVGFDPMTDAELAKYFSKPEPIAGAKFANASAHFVNLVRAGKLAHMDAVEVGDDLTWTARKASEESGTYQAVRADDSRPITAALAAIRAVWLATGPQSARPRIY